LALTLDAQRPLAGLSGQADDIFLAAFADGHIQIISNSIDPNVLWDMLTFAGKKAAP
jgi:hypothetical protein